MNNNLRTAIEMISAGYTLEEVLDITGVNPQVLFDALINMLDDVQTKEFMLKMIEDEGIKHFVVETNEKYKTSTLGVIRVNMN